MIVIAPSEYELLLRISEKLQESFDLGSCLQATNELLQELIGCEHVALAISRPGTTSDYEWYNTTLPGAYFAGYGLVAERDFVRAAVAAAPNRVLVDQQMITRKEYERHVLFQHSKATGANLEQVIAVMLQYEPSSSAGITCYRTSRVPFAQREVELLTRLVPHFNAVIRRSREYVALQRSVWLDTVVEYAGVAAIWVTRAGWRSPARQQPPSCSSSTFLITCCVEEGCRSRCFHTSSAACQRPSWSQPFRTLWWSAA